MSVAVQCENHPKRQSTVRCLACGMPLCALCTVQTPGGERCKGCAIRTPRQPLERRSWPMAVPLLTGLAAAVTFIVCAEWLYSIPGLGLVPFIGLLVAFLVGIGIGQVLLLFSPEYDRFSLMAFAVIDVIVANVIIQLASLVFTAQLLGLSTMPFLTGPSITILLEQTVLGSLFMAAIAAGTVYWVDG